MKKSEIDESSYELQGSSVYLPEDVILKILASLPAKSVGRCRCLSKRWRTRLSDPKFIEAHLDLSRRRRLKSVLLYQISVFEVDVHDSVASSTELKKFEMPNNAPDDWMGICCSYNGLVLAQGLTYRLFLLNPTIQECKELPKPPARDSLDGDDLFLMLGMGDNKNVAIRDDHDVYVCSLGRDTSTTWKTPQIQNSPLDYCAVLGGHRNGVFFNGSIHWLGYIRYSPRAIPIIIAFDLTEEMFRVVPTPLHRVNWGRDNLEVVGESLCITYEKCVYVDGEHHQRVEVWVMNEYGAESSWTKLQFPHCHPQHIGFCCKYPLCLGNEEFMFNSSISKAVIHNVKENSSREIDISELPFKLTPGSAVDCFALCADSLVSSSQLITSKTDGDQIIG